MKLRRIGVFLVLMCSAALAQTPPLRLTRDKNLLTITGGTLPGAITINYIEAYARAGSTNRNWRTETVIPHRSEVVSSRPDGFRARAQGHALRRGDRRTQNHRAHRRGGFPAHCAQSD